MWRKREHNIGVSLFKVLHTLNIWGVGEGERTFLNTLYSWKIH